GRGAGPSGVLPVWHGRALAAGAVAAQIKPADPGLSAADVWPLAGIAEYRLSGLEERGPLHHHLLHALLLSPGAFRYFQGARDRVRGRGGLHCNPANCLAAKLVWKRNALPDPKSLRLPDRGRG